MTRLWQGVVILAVVAGTFSQTDIDVQCGRDSVQVTWNIIPERVSNVSRHFLGTCRPSTFSVLPTGEGVLLFNYPLYDCKFRTLITERQLVYANDLTYRPFGKPTAAEFTHPIECVYRRPDTWMPPFLTPGSGTLEGHGGLVFHMELLNEQLTGMAKNNVFALGSFIPIWAAVEQGSHQPLLLLLEECYAIDTPELRPDSRVHRIITEKGCLLDSKEGNSKFLPRYHSSAILLHLQAFRFPLGEVYIHCKLVAWDPEVLDERKKACHYIKETGGWELLDDPSQSDICSCCESSCGTRRKRGLRSEPLGVSQNAVLGPLTIVESLQSHNKS